MFAGFYASSYLAGLVAAPFLFSGEGFFGMLPFPIELPLLTVVLGTASWLLWPKRRTAAGERRRILPDLRRLLAWVVGSQAIWHLAFAALNPSLAERRQQPGLFFATSPTALLLLGVVLAVLPWWIWPRRATSPAVAMP